MIIAEIMGFYPFFLFIIVHHLYNARVLVANIPLFTDISWLKALP